MSDRTDDITLTDLEVIQQFSLAVRGASAPRDAVIRALEADLAYLTGGRRATAPAPAERAASKPAAAVKAPAAKAVDKPAARPAAKAPAKPAAKRAPAKGARRA